jgi:hypothetical protein
VAEILCRIVPNALLSRHFFWFALLSGEKHTLSSLRKVRISYEYMFMYRHDSGSAHPDIAKSKGKGFDHRTLGDRDTQVRSRVSRAATKISAGDRIRG